MKTKVAILFSDTWDTRRENGLDIGRNRGVRGNQARSTFKQVLGFRFLTKRVGYPFLSWEKEMFE
jgi:hypothetical protein